MGATSTTGRDRQRRFRAGDACPDCRYEVTVSMMRRFFFTNLSVVRISYTKIKADQFSTRLSYIMWLLRILVQVNTDAKLVLKYSG